MLGGMSGQITFIRSITSTEDIQYDLSKGITGNPILMCNVTGTATMIINTSQDFFSINYSIKLFTKTIFRI